MTTGAEQHAQDEAHMRAALSLAARGLGNTWPNPAVGCVVVRDGQVVGRGWTAPVAARMRRPRRCAGPARPRVAPPPM
ncbi:hypothetical protein ACFQU7_04790 [Pseudoroseomonas wenyumeiae]